MDSECGGRFVTAPRSVTHGDVEFGRRRQAMLGIGLQKRLDRGDPQFEIALRLRIRDSKSPAQLELRLSEQRALREAEGRPVEQVLPRFTGFGRLVRGQLGQSQAVAGLDFERDRRASLWSDPLP